jgi:general secretion pathway protein G
MSRDLKLAGSSIFFPWERRGGMRRLFGKGRVRPALLIACIVGFVLLVGARERRASGIRQTRATLLAMRRAVDSFLAENAGACPQHLEQVLDFATFKKVPTDAWGNPLRLVCPARREGERYELLSDGPDGLPGGLDRIE